MGVVHEAVWAAVFYAKELSTGKGLQSGAYLGVYEALKGGQDS